MWGLVTKREPQYWLMKSEPDVYAIDDLARERTGTWEGVRNFQARNFMRAMRRGDFALFYHSSTTPPGVVGVMRIAKEAYPDTTQFDPKSPYYDPKSPVEAPRWDRVDVTFVRKLPLVVTLDHLKADPACADMMVIRRGMRLSVQPISAAEFAHVVALGGKKPRKVSARS
jgi:predicted RNA-binding protein with PUA-like domain